MEADLRIDPRLTIPGEELGIATSRSGGPGGQHVNTTESRVTIRWQITTSVALSDEAKARLIERLGRRVTLAGELVISVSDERSQLTNREIARERLAAAVRAARVELAPRRPTKPSRGSKERRIQAKKVRSAHLKNRSGGQDD